MNVPIADTWNGSLPILRDLASGHLTLAALWAPHNENRMLFPALLVAFLDLHSGLNSKLDMYVGALFLIAAGGLLTWLAAKTLGQADARLVGVPVLALSLAQYENLLWAFQVAWFLILLCLVGALACLESPRRSWLLFALACVLGVIASWSSLQGLLTWPTGLVYLACAGRSRATMALWTAVGVFAGGVYGWHFPSTFLHPSLRFVFAHPALSLHYGLRLVGGVFPWAPGSFGLGVLVILGLALVAALQLGVTLRQLRLVLGLITFALLFDIVVTLGRIHQNVPTSSRYTTYTLLLLVALYLLGLLLLNAWRGRTGRRGSAAGGAAPIVVGVIALLCCLQVGGSVTYGLKEGAAERAGREHAALVLREFRSEPDSALAAALFPPSGPYVREWAAWLQARRWSVFAA